jgi:hypothetical protein
VNELTSKWLRNFHEILVSDLPRLGGSWVSAFFLIGLLVPYRKPFLGRVRLFVVLGLGLMVVFRSLGRPWAEAAEGLALPDEVLSSFGPVIFIFGIGLFFSLLDQLTMKIPGIRFPVLGLFCLVASAPLLLGFFMATPSRIALPYYPPWIQEKSTYLEEEDWMMSDIPWAVAWYGGRSCVWLPPYYRNPGEGKYRNDFFEIHGHFKPINALYLSGKTLNKVRTEPMRYWIGRTDDGAGWEDSIWEWESFILVGIYLKNEVPTGFPLQNAPLGIFPELFLVDSEHFAPKTIQTP